MKRDSSPRACLVLCVTVVLLAIMSPTIGVAQSQSQSDSWSQPQTRTPQRQSSSQPSSLNGDAFRGYAGFEGAYAQFGVAVGEIEFDGRVNVDGGGGFTITGGYRFLPWLAGEGNVTYLGGGEVGNSNRNADFFAFTFGPKIYPLGLVEEQPIPEFIQPYGLIAIGGGEYDIENTGAEQSTFIARFIFGFDVWITDNIGTFVEGGYHVAGDDNIHGTGIFTFGGQYRF